MGLLRGLGRLHQQLPAHAEVAGERVPGVQREPEVLAAAPCGQQGPAGEQCPEVLGSRHVPAHRPRVRDLHRRDRAADHAALQAPGGRPRPRAARALGADRGGRSRQRAPAPRAAGRPGRPPARRPSCCRPSPSPRTRPSTTACAANRLAWSGPVSVSRYSGRAVPRAAASSCSAVFQSRAPSVLVTSASSGANEPADHGGRRREAALEVDRADDRLGGVGQQRVLVARRRWSPRPCRAAATGPGRGRGAIPARARVLTTAARSLASCPSASPGCVPVEGVGDDQPEDGVAEELQPLVRRQPAVLVRVRAVGERLLEQRGREPGAERRLEPGVGDRAGHGHQDRQGQTCTTVRLS